MDGLNKEHGSRVQLIAEIIDSDEVLELRAAGPRSRWNFTCPPRLMVAALGLRYLGRWGRWLRSGGASLPGCEPWHGIALISADIGPIGKAKRHGLPAIRAMECNWTLPPEADDRDKKINQLEKTLKAANEQHPEISAVTTANGKEISQLVIEATVYPPLPEARIAELLAELERKYPRATDFPKPGEDYKPPPERKGSGIDLAHLEAPFDWEPPSSEPIEQYNVSYDRWLADARTLMETIPAAMQHRHFEGQFALALTNVGNLAASDVWMSFEAKGAVLLKDDRGKGGEEGEMEKAKPLSPVETALKEKLRSPPAAPTWKKVYRPSPSPKGVMASSLATRWLSCQDQASRTGSLRPGASLRLGKSLWQRLS